MVPPEKNTLEGRNVNIRHLLRQNRLHLRFMFK